MKLLSERQEVLNGMVEDMIRFESRATENYYEQIFEEVTGSLVTRTEKKHILIQYQSERDKARMLQKSGGSRVIRKEADMQDTLSSESCRSSVVDDMEEVSSESSRKMQDLEARLNHRRLLLQGRKDGKEKRRRRKS